MWPFNSYPTITTKELRDSYDYIIVGGGTAGCVLANRLSQTNAAVLLLERGNTKSNSQPPYCANPHTDSSLCDNINSVLQPHIGERVVPYVSPHVLGGQSKVNNLIYTRAPSIELDSWSAGGMSGWSSNDLLPYFLKSENAISQKDNSSFHNTKEAATALGFSTITDMNDPTQSLYGVGPYAFTINEKSRRCDVASAFLPSKLVKTRQANLTICVNAIVIRLKLVTTATEDVIIKGVVVENYNDKKSQTFEVSARKEVILCAGAIGTPQLLMLSGIGPMHRLSSVGIAVEKHSPNVGSGLDSLDAMLKSIFNRMGQAIQYTFSGGSVKRPPPVLATAMVNSQMISLDSDQIIKGGFPNPNPGDPSNISDIEITAYAFGSVDAKGNVDKDTKGSGGFSLHVKLTKPKSTGTVELKSTNARDSPACDPNYFGNREDRRVAYTGIRLAMHLKEAMAKSGYSIIDFNVPIDDSEAELDKFIAKYGYSASQLSSTCRMGPENNGGVVNDQLELYGVAGLRIGDASVFPSSVTRPHQATVVAVAEKCADTVIKAHANPLFDTHYLPRIVRFM
ncbi:hypothetical protein Clacol_006866 [Clathrus columnatus]|uniref:Glucose-methanol-choline oxidoreductase N-terminal domain-containing protein n=1 Tax=Clathrus columnatus TaxID=1419009 RepID=A0AAV5AHL9_9AGAM|nr:hypothetical protein Clacol_006866 [Clathrus columnatus]